MGAMFAVYGLRLVANLAMGPVADKKLYFWLTVAKMHAFVVFTKKYVRSYGCNGTNFTATINFTSPKSELQSEILEIQIFFLC